MNRCCKEYFREKNRTADQTQISSGQSETPNQQIVRLTI